MSACQHSAVQAQPEINPKLNPNFILWKLIEAKRTGEPTSLPCGAKELPSYTFDKINSGKSDSADKDEYLLSEIFHKALEQANITKIKGEFIFSLKCALLNHPDIKEAMESSNLYFVVENPNYDGSITTTILINPELDDHDFEKLRETSEEIVVTMLSIFKRRFDSIFFLDKMNLSAEELSHKVGDISSDQIRELIEHHIKMMREIRGVSCFENKYWSSRPSSFVTKSCDKAGEYIVIYVPFFPQSHKNILVPRSPIQCSVCPIEDERQDVTVLRLRWNSCLLVPVKPNEEGIKVFIAVGENRVHLIFGKKKGEEKHEIKKVPINVFDVKIPGQNDAELNRRWKEETCMTQWDPSLQTTITSPDIFSYIKQIEIALSSQIMSDFKRTKMEEILEDAKRYANTFV